MTCPDYITDRKCCKRADRSIHDGICQYACQYGKRFDLVFMPKLRGLGDLIAAGTKAIGIKPCRGCGKRQEKLNEVLPFTTTLKAR